jgi:hypothetical protein
MAWFFKIALHKLKSAIKAVLLPSRYRSKKNETKFNFSLSGKTLLGKIENKIKILCS